MKKVLILNGPNLNLLGKREPGVYGQDSYEAVCARIAVRAKELGMEASFAQSNSEGALVDALHGAMDTYDAVVLNPGAYTHYSYAVRDAIAAIRIPSLRCICPTSTPGRNSGIPPCWPPSARGRSAALDRSAICWLFRRWRRKREDGGEKRAPGRLFALRPGGALITSDYNRRYLTGFRSSAGAVLVTREEAYFLTDFRYIEAARRYVRGAQCLCYRRMTDTLEELAARHGLECLYIEGRR